MIYISGSTIGQNPDRVQELPWQDGLAGIEVGFLNSWHDAVAMRNFATEHRLAYGVHIPLLRDEEHFIKWLPPLSEQDQLPALQRLQKNLALTRQQEAAYAIIHIPSRHFDSERKPSVTVEEHEMWVARSCNLLARWATEQRIPIHVEVDGPNPYFGHAEDFIRMLESYPGLCLCLDMLKIFFLNCWFPGYRRPWRKFVEQLAPYTASLHLQNINYHLVHTGLRLPPHPSQKPKDGWLDVGWIIETVLGANPNCHLTLEHVHTEREQQYYREMETTYERYLRESIDWLYSFL